MKLFQKSLIFMAGTLLLVTACQQSPKATGDSEQSELLDKSEIEASLEEMVNPLPEPFKVYTMLEDIGASYLGGVLNRVENSDKYFSQKSKAANVGVYTADLGYAAAYSKTDDVKAYSKTLKSLLDDLGISIDYSAILSEEAKSMLENKDSLLAFVSQEYYKSYEFLYKESTPELSALMAAGAWTEGLYIATHISEDTYQNTDIVKIIFEQGESLGELIKFMDNFQNDEMVVSLSNAFKKLKILYDETDGSLTEEQLNSITSTIETIRESIIS